MAKIESRLPVELDAATIANHIEKRHPFIRLFRHEKEREHFYYRQCTKGDLANFLIASIYPARMLLLRVRLAIDTEERRLAFTITTHFDGLSPQSPTIHIALESTIHIAGIRSLSAVVVETIL